MDLAVTSSHTKPTFALQTHSNVCGSWAEWLQLLHPPQNEQHSPWGSVRLLHLGGVYKISPPQSIYCALVLEDSSSCTTQRSTVFSWSHFPSVFHPTWGWGCIFRFVGGRFPLDQNCLSIEASPSLNKNLSITCWFLQSNLKDHSLACTPQQIFMKKGGICTPETARWHTQFKEKFLGGGENGCSWFSVQFLVRKN